MNGRTVETFYVRPVVPLLLSMILGIAGGAGFPGFSIWAYGIVLASAGIILFSIKEKKPVLISPILLLLVLGYLSIQPWIVPKFPPHHIIHFLDTHPWKITGVIDTPVDRYPNRQKMILHAEFLEYNEKSFSVAGRIRLTVAGKGPDFRQGDRVALFSKIKSIRNFNNPGGFDYKRHMMFKKVWGSAYVSAQKITLIHRQSGGKVGQFIAEERRNISDLIDQTGNGKEQAVLKAVIIGDKNAISKDLRNTFNRAGVSHLLAISGLHIGIVATVAFFFLRWILSHIHLFLRNAWTKKGAVLLSLIPVFIYGLLSGMSPSTQRAVIMVSVFLAAFLFEREHDPMNTLALAAILILIVHPPALYSISFQLSFTAVLAIIYGLSKTGPLWESVKHKASKPWKTGLVTKLFYFSMASVFAVLGTLPLVMFYFNQISLVGIPTNFIMVPLIGFVVIPLGLLGVFLYPVTVFGSLLCFKAGAAVLGPTLGVLTFLADLPFAAIKTVTPSFLEICCFYLFLWAILNLKYVPLKITLLQNHTKNTEKNLSVNNHIQKTALIIAFFVTVVFGIDTAYWAYHRWWHDDFRVTMIDVGHGNAALLELPHGYDMLVDGGGFPDNLVFDMGAYIIARVLWQKKIKTIDTLVLSHPNSDHLNGLIYIAEHFNVKNVWTNHEDTKTFGYKKFVETIQHHNINWPSYDKIYGVHQIEGVAIDILYPPGDYIEKKKKERWRNMNNNSLVLKASYGSESFLFPGDIETRAEYELVSTGGNKLKSTVLLAPHHGSKTSSSQLFLETVAPELVIISSGWKSRFGFPHPSVLKRYKKQGCRIFETAENGAISIKTDGKTLRVKPTIAHKKAF